MAEKTMSREYVIPLRKEWLKVPKYKRSRKGVVAIKEFIAKHMRVEDRDLDKVRLDVYLNNEIWHRGTNKPLSRVKVKATKEDGIVRVELAEMPENWKFVKARQEKRHTKATKKEVKEEKKEEKSEEEEKKEEEKQESVEQANLKMAEKAAKAEKHTVKTNPNQTQHRKALQK